MRRRRFHHVDDIRRHRREQRQQFIAGPQAHMVPTQRLAKVLDETEELRLADVVVCMHVAHGVAAVVAAAASKVADLFDDQPLDTRNVCALEGLIQARVGNHRIDGFVHHGRHHGFATETCVETG
jgi:hypothetical protein